VEVTEFTLSTFPCLQNDPGADGKGRSQLTRTRGWYDGAPGWSSDGKVIARGLSNYSAGELASVRGKRTAQIAKEIDGDFSEEVIHRDFMVLL